MVSTYHLLIWQLSTLDAAALPHSLLVPFALGVTEQVHFRGDLQTQRLKVSNRKKKSKKVPR